MGQTEGARTARRGRLRPRRGQTRVDGEVFNINTTPPRHPRNLDLLEPQVEPEIPRTPRASRSSRRKSTPVTSRGGRVHGRTQGRNARRLQRQDPAGLAAACSAMPSPRRTTSNGERRPPVPLWRRAGSPSGGSSGPGSGSAACSAPCGARRSLRRPAPRGWAACRANHAVADQGVELLAAERGGRHLGQRRELGDREPETAHFCHARRRSGPTACSRRSSSSRTRPAASGASQRASAAACVSRACQHASNRRAKAPGRSA